MSPGLFTQITQATLDLVTSHMDVFLATGQHMYNVIATVLVIWEGLQVALGGMFRGDRFARLILALAITGAMIHFYDQPFPGVGLSFHKIITDTGASLAEQIDQRSAEDLGTKIANAEAGLIFPIGMTWFDLSPVIYYYGSVFLMSIAQVALLGVIAFGFVAVGCIVLVGPVFIPFFLVPKLDWIFWGWFKALIQYSFYPVFANAFVLVFGQIWLNFFSQNGYAGTVQQIAGVFVQFVILATVFIFGMLQVPKLVSNVFAGQAGEHSMPGIGWWR
jgi:type IV secretory pathway VirB6-like protein